MSEIPRILAFAGSARRESFNRKLLNVAIQAVREKGGLVNLIDLNEFAMPLYHGDLEDRDGMPPNAMKLVDLIVAHTGLLIASPEYNSFPTPLLKNTLDWCTRAEDNPFVGKVAAVVSASPGAFGALNSLRHVRHLLLHLGCHVVPSYTSVPKAGDAFDDRGVLKEPRTLKSIQTVAADLVSLCRKLGA